jgi:hypothetical protein
MIEKRCRTPAKEKKFAVRKTKRKNKAMNSNVDMIILFYLQFVT